MKKVTLKFKGGSVIPEFSTTQGELFTPGELLRMKRAIDVGYKLWKKQRIIEEHENERGTEG